MVKKNPTTHVIKITYLSDRSYKTGKKIYGMRKNKLTMQVEKKLKQDYILIKKQKIVLL